MIYWQWKKFDELATEELYQVLRLRAEIFVVEQNCPYQDIDNSDQAAWHLLGWHTDNTGSRTLCAYLRVFAPGIKYQEIALGRVLVKMAHRKSGLGRELMAQALAKVNNEFTDSAIRISAQSHLEQFYGELGFARVSAPYDEDGIPHIEMLKI